MAGCAYVYMCVCISVCVSRLLVGENKFVSSVPRHWNSVLCVCTSVWV